MQPNGMNQAELKKMNIGLLLRLIHQESGMTRADLANITGLTVAAVAKLVEELLDEGLVIEVEPNSQKRGRPASGLAFRKGSHQVLAVKLSRRYVRWGVFGFEGNPKPLFASEDVLTEELQSDELQGLLLQGIHFIVRKYPDIRAVGIAVPGPFDSERLKINVLTEMTNLKGLDLSSLCQNNSIPPVFFIHDANAGAMSEWLIMDPKVRDSTTLAYYLIGEGVGVGIIDKGEIFEGHRGMAGELGHVSIDPEGGRCRCGNRGCLEMFSSSIAVERKAERERTRDPNSVLNKIHPLKIANILNAASQGDELASHIITETAYALALGAVNIVNAYDPDLIIIGDRLARGGEYLLNLIQPILKDRTAYREDEIRVEIEDPTYDHILHGAASIAIRKCLEDPTLLEANQRNKVH